jgi:hypothetical protein
MNLLFDNYAVKARLYPVVLLFLPILILGTTASLSFRSSLYIFTSVVVVGSLTYLFSQLGRDRGKLKEPELWSEWGGAPSTQLLRYSNFRIDIHTKRRYHKKLLERCPVSTEPNDTLEKSDPLKADEVYQTWTKFLIAQTRDVAKFSLLFKENVSYGFRRNTWALRPLGIVLCILCLIINYVYWMSVCHTLDPTEFPDLFYYSTAIIMLFIVFWVFIVTKDWVKLPAFSYAERLLECTELI